MEFENMGADIVKLYLVGGQAGNSSLKGSVQGARGAFTRSTMRSPIAEILEVRGDLNLEINLEIEISNELQARKRKFAEH